MARGCGPGAYSGEGSNAGASPTARAGTNVIPRLRAAKPVSALADWVSDRRRGRGGRKVNMTESTTDTETRGETEQERINRNWDKLLQELRVTQTGIQILSGFLLTLPFQQRFTALDDTLRALYLVAVVLATLSTALVVAPVAAHRLLFRKHQKIQLVDVSDRLAKIGLSCVALTVVTVLALVFGFVLGHTAAYVAGGVALVVFVVLWGL